MKKSSRVISSLVVAVTSLVAAGGAQAQSSMGGDLYGAGKSYIGLNAGESDFNLNNGTGLFGSESHDTAYNLYVGNYFSYNFGFEVGYTNFGRASRRVTRPPSVGLMA